MGLFSFVCFSCGYDSDNFIIFTKTVTYDQNAKRETHSEHDETIFGL